MADTQDGSRWESMTWRRRLETSGPDGRSIPAQGPGGQTGSIWYVSEARSSPGGVIPRRFS